MLFDNQRANLRMPFFEAFRKMKMNAPLTPLEQQLASIIRQHPEYHTLLEQPERYLETDDWSAFDEKNPFMHMALHQALSEQLTTNRPAGILAIYHALCQQLGDPHRVEHQMIVVLEKTLEKMQQGHHVSENDYLAALKKINSQ